MRIRFGFAVVVATLVLSTTAYQARQAPAKVDFATDVLPILRQNCIGCHGPKEQKNGLRLDRRRDAFRGGTIAVIGRGNADGSRLYHRLTGERFGVQMPPTGPLPPAQIATIKNWIDQGAEWPDELSGDTPPAPPDPSASRLMTAIRSADRAAISSIIASEPEAAKRAGFDGATPLMYAALYADVATMRTLVEKGADVNAADENGVTPLIWAVADMEKTRFLIERGAQINARSRDGRTPLLIASVIPGATATVKLLLDNGANIRDRAPSLFGGTTPLIQAAYLGGEATFQLLVERGADLEDGGAAALGLAMRQQCMSCVQAMMKALNPAAYTAAMIIASPPRGPALAAAMLLDAGADINARDPEGRTILMLAAASDAASVEMVKLLVDRGVDINARSVSGDTALTYARLRGNTAITQALEKAGAIDGRGPATIPVNYAPARSTRAALERSLPLLQKSDEVFLKKSGCVSCHHNTLGAMTVSLARARGIPVNEPVATHQRKVIGEYVDSWRGRVLQGIGIPGDTGTMSYILMGLAAEKYPADASTDAIVRLIRLQQTSAGLWLPLAHRPPIETSPIHTTALAVRALQLYAPAAEKEAYLASVERGGKFLAVAPAASQQDRAFQVLGLHWSNASRATVLRAAKALVKEQRPDGGWAQLPTLDSDAYATGQALVALAESGSVSVSDPAYKRGVAFLLKTQFADGSWFVRSRVIPLQPHFESEFPYGKDQFISAAGTNWASMALAYAIRAGS